MTDVQSNRLDMYVVVKQFYNSYQPLIDTVTARANAFAAFLANIIAINANIAVQSLVTKGVTANKQLIRTNLDEMTYTIFAIVRAWALANEDLTNAEEFHFSQSAIARIKDDTLVPFLEHRVPIINDNLTPLADYGITASLLDAWGDVMDSYADANGAPRFAIVARSTGTAQLQNLFDVNQKLLKDTMDPLMLLIKASNPDVYHAYLGSRVIIDRHGPGGQDPTPPVETTSVIGHIIDGASGSIVSGASLVFTNGDWEQQVFSDENGIYVLSITDLTEEVTVTCTVSHPLYGAVSRSITIAPLDNLTEDFELTPVPPAS